MAALALAAVAAAHAGDGAAARAGMRAAEYRDYLAAYATCTVRENHGRAANAVLSDLDAGGLGKRFADIFIEKPVVWVADCHELHIAEGLSMWMKGEPLRMALADALVKAELRDDKTESFADRAPLPLQAPKKSEERAAAAGAAYERDQQRYDQRVAQTWLWAFGECVARREPVRSREWLLSRAGTAEDTAASERLAPAFGSCLPEGQKLVLDRDMLRGSVAVSYYRLAKAQPVTGSGTVQ